MRSCDFLAALALTLALACIPPVHADTGGSTPLSAEIAALRSTDAPQRLSRIGAAARALTTAVLPDDQRTRLMLQLGFLAESHGDAGLRIAFEAFDAGLSLARVIGDDRLLAEAYDRLGGLYETRHRHTEATRLTELGVLHAQRADAHDLLIRLEWRLGRLFDAQGDEALALAALQRAVRHIDAIRADIPVRYEDGRSSFRETLAPIYLALADLQLRQSRHGGESRPALLRQARNTIELIKRSELEDYFRDRCTVDSVPPDAAGAASGTTAIYYPIILPDRLELLVESEAGFEQRTVAVPAARLQAAIADFIASLRSAGPYRADAERLYGWLIAPIDDLIRDRHIETLVTIPDGALRLVPMAALHDGKGFLVERLTVTTLPGLSIAAPRSMAGASPRVLLAGLSEPGPVVARLPEALTRDLPATAAGPLSRFSPPPDLRSLTTATRSVATPFEEPADLQDRKLRTALALPGVRREIGNLASLVSGNVLLDRDFTLSAFRRELAQNDYSVVHIASHGLFGDSTDNTFIMTYDELMTLDGLRDMMSGRRKPVDLITLSACQTAEGDDRAPLGFAGIALKARARSALGALWPVSDDVTQAMMSSFYGSLARGGQTKAEALRDTQRKLIAGGEFDHPFYWAPFILVGDWR